MSQFSLSRARRRGFTLLQLVIVVAILAILSGVIMSVFSRSKSAAHRVQCDTHLKSLALALDAFKQEQGTYPSMLQELVTLKYVTDESLMKCPADPRGNSSYQDFYAIRGPRDKNELPILICPFHDGTHGVQAFVGKYTDQFLTAPAILTAASGVTVEHPGKTPIAAPVGLELHGADILRTEAGGSATITFADKSTAELGGNTQITIMQSYIEGNSQSPLYTLVRQATGAANYTVNHGSKFDVVTPTATAGALGTQFEIRINSKDETTWLRVTEGKVNLTTVEGGAVIDNSDDSWAATEPQAPPPGDGQRRPPPPRPRRRPLDAPPPR